MAIIGIWGLFHGRGSGIGKMLAEYLGSKENSIIGIGRKSPEDETFPVDKIIEIEMNDFETAEHELVDKIGHLDVLIVTAGIGYPHPIWDIDLPKIKEMASVNFVLPAWILSRTIHCTNHILLTGSIAGILPRDGSSIYAGTKAGIIAFAESARKELKQHYIQTINFNNIHRIGKDKVLKTYEFMINNPSNMDISINI